MKSPPVHLNETIRVANLIEESRWGGPQKRIVIVSKELRTHNVETVVLLASEYSERFRQELEAAGIQYRCIRMANLAAGWRPLANYLFCFGPDVLRIYRELRAANVDLVHVSGGAWQIRAAIASWLARIPLVWHLNDTRPPKFVKPVFEFLASRIARGFIVAGLRVKETYLSKAPLSEMPTFVVPAPVDVGINDPANTRPDEAIAALPGTRVVTVANINPIKGIETLIEAAAVLRDAGQLFSYIVVGPVYSSQQDYMGRLKVLIQRNGLDRNFHFVGQSENVPAVLKASSVVVCSSRYEASPMSVWEAMAMECAVVSTDVGDVSQYIESGESGFVVPTGDAKAMAKAIACLANDVDLRRAMGKKAREIACSLLDVRNIAASTYNAYLGTISRLSALTKSRRRGILGIDASNIHGGGGVTHLVELLKEADPISHGFEKVVLWSSHGTGQQVEDRDWLVKNVQPMLDKGLPLRVLWQQFRLGPLARLADCDLLFVPGGLYTGSFRPMVTMSRNMLPFVSQEIRRYGFSQTGFRLRLLRVAQEITFRRAAAVIFLTRWARSRVLSQLGKPVETTIIIPHGVNTRFRKPPRQQLDIASYSVRKPFKIIYVSIVDMYKHQWHVATAVHRLRSRGWPVVLELIGSAHPLAMARLKRELSEIDPHGEFVDYVGHLSHSELSQRYVEADLGVFASSCENMPNILLEMMASGLPIACSNRGPMPEVLEDAGTYFDPENPDEIAVALERLMASAELRATLAKASFERAWKYSWQRCANDTFAFLGHMVRRRATFTNETTDP